MFSKLWFLICATQLVIIKGTYDPANSGIKTRSYHRDLPNAEQQNQQSPPYTNTHPRDSRFSPSYDNTNYGAPSLRLSPPDSHQHIDEPRRQQQQQQQQPSYQHQQQHLNPQQAESYQQREQPIFNRPAHVRHSPPSERQVESAWSGTENSIGDHNSGCPPQHTGPVPYPYDCRRFVNCWHGRGHIQSCGPGTVFNPETLECDRPDKVVCGTPGVNGVSSELNVRQTTLQTASNPNKYRAGRLLDVSTGNVDSLCPAGVNGLAPHPTDCTKFLNCANGNTHVQNCGPGTAYSISMKTCDFKEKVDCSGRENGGNGALNSRDGRQYENNNYDNTRDEENGSTANQESDIFCPPGVIGLFPHPFDYTRFLNCKLGNTAIQNCMPGSVYSISRNYCDLKEKTPNTDHVDYVISEVQQLPSTMVSCPPSTDGNHLYPYDSTKFITCRQGRMSIDKCGSHKVFSISAQTCRPESEVTIGDRVRNAVAANSNAEIRDSRNYVDQPLDCPQGQSGLYPHPFDCRKFMLCRNGKLSVESCKTGNVFSLSAKHCDPKELVNVNEQVQFQLDVGQDRVSESDYNYNNGGHGYDANTHFQAPTPQSNNRNPTRNEWIPQPNSAPSHHRGTYDSHSYGGIPTMPSSRTNTRGDRWFNMDRQRPVPHDDTRFIPEGTYNPDYDRQQRLPVYGKDLRHNNGPASWAGTSAALDRQTPTQSVIYEEGSLEPNRNYNTIQTYTTPLAPFNSADSLPAASVNRNVYANATTNIYYAQPVGSEENSDEVFDSNADSQPSARTPLDRNDNKWIPIPNQVLLPPKRTTEQQSVLQVSAPANSYAPATHVTPPSRRAYNPPTTVSQNAIEASNLYGGLQPPPPPPTTAQTPYSIVSIRNQNSPPAPVNPTQSSPPPRPTGRSLVDSFEPIRGFSTNVDGKPHLLSSPSNTNLYQTEILTSTPANYLQPPTAPTAVTKTHSAGTTRLKQVHPFLENTTVAMFSKDPHYSGSYSNVAHASPPQSIDPQAYQSAENLPMADALRLLLRPYFNRSGTISEDSAEKAESHIMKLTAEQPSVHSVMNTLPHTTTNKSKVGAENEKEVELILAGEQHSLSTNPTENSVHGSRTDIYSKNTKQESKNNPNWHNRGHNREYHRTHPNLLNPFDEVDQSSPHRHHHNHNRAFHERHPEMPNPFATPVTLRTVPTTTNNFDLTNANPPNPYAESTTPFSVRPEIDLRAGQDVDCQFDCGNGKCVKSFEVCNGINNCGNRKDEDNCKHLGYEVRLAGGESANMGRVEVKILGKWGYVCDDKFGLRDAEVVCRELGFKLGASEVRGYSYYPPTETEVSFVMDEVDCRGDESSLRECNFKGWGVSNCGPDEVVGVVCKVPQLKCPNNYWLCSTSQECIPPAFVCDHTPDCADKSDESDNVCNSPVEYRLQGGRSPSEGRLEVRYRGEWGTVCDDDFGLKEAQVICNSMGFYGLPTIAKNVYGPGSGPIWLDQVSCFGNETSLEQCNHWTWGEHNCNHTEDVGLKCTVGVQSQKVSTPQTDRNHVDGNGRKELDDPQQELEDIGLFSEWERKSKAIGTQRRRCGQFKDNLLDEYAHPEERVVNGSLAKRGHHPWQATIRTRGRGGISSHWCGAVLISSRHLLTAAHCLAGYPKGAYLVRLGDHYANIAEASEIDSFIENWYVHEKFRDATHMNNDIAMIVLKTPVKFNDYIQPVCLPSKDATVTENRKCTISGWGSIKSGVSTPSNILRAAELPILSDDVCKQPHVYGASLTEGMFCAGYMDESVDACDGDSGGPLICHDEDGETLYGIISWGQHCGYANKPGVYVRVEKYVDWIMDKINFSIQNAT
ncbi:uncharacterized protein LOC118746806 isoform X9 [Rhagoletis pomonella]|uniref:uncharacterized protein LOC118746806 isoform X9 n=1 Tax=Rhagoletis pomonella TaxID=28610 RepID=UPI00178313A7|nr:uncharacterized protein LOC118746806 isoform X9 [Rhagoletis pomonella]